MKVAIVGAGVMGCATAWALRERGAEVTVHEQFGLDHDRGSSHGRTRIFRIAYPEQFWVRLAQEAYAGWQELDPSLLGLYGLIELVADPALTSARALDECGVPYRLLDRDEVRAHGAVLPDGWTALYVADAGVVFADRARHALLEAAGAEVETNRRVESTDDLDADVVVVTAGSWIRELVPDVPVTVTRETVAYFRRESPPPPSIVDLNAETGGHGMYSLSDPVHGLKAGAHHAGVEADPDADGAPDPAIVERIAAWVRERFPDVDPDPVEAQTCLYTTTADEHFVLERHGRVVVGSACSGHGFKFAPAVGRRLADLALSWALRFRLALLPAPRRRPTQAPRPVPGERDAPHRGGDGARGVHRQRVDPLPPPVALSRHGARRLRADRARGVGARPARAPALQDVRHRARRRRDHRPTPPHVEQRRRDLAVPP